MKSVCMLCGAEEACLAHNQKVGGSKPPKATRIQLTEHTTGFSSVGRAFDCRGIQTSNSRWFDSGKPEITTFNNFVRKVVQNLSGILLHFLKCIWSYSEIVSRLLLNKNNWGRTSYDLRYWTTDFFLGLIV